MVYDINGQEIGNGFISSCQMTTGKHEGTMYYVLRIFKKKQDGTNQYPFVVATNGTAASDKSALDYALTHNNEVTINAGLGHLSSGNYSPAGVIVENGVAIHDEQMIYYPLIIDGNGNLSEGSNDATAAELISGGAVSVVCGFAAIVKDYVAIGQEDYPETPTWSEYAQRQIIGQFANGDYAIITSEGRNNDNSTGWTIPQAQALCVSMNLKFAYNLDGGGSTETILGKKQINTIYEGTTGRKVCSLIVFNGKSTFPSL